MAGFTTNGVSLPGTIVSRVTLAGGEGVSHHRANMATRAAAGMADQISARPRAVSERRGSGWRPRDCSKTPSSKSRKSPMSRTLCFGCFLKHRRKKASTVTDWAVRHAHDGVSLMPPSPVRDVTS